MRHSSCLPQSVAPRMSATASATLAHIHHGVRRAEGSPGSLRQIDARPKAAGTRVPTVRPT